MIVSDIEGRIRFVESGLKNPSRAGAVEKRLQQVAGISSAFTSSCSRKNSRVCINKQKIQHRTSHAGAASVVRDLTQICRLYIALYYKAD